MKNKPEITGLPGVLTLKKPNIDMGEWLSKNRGHGLGSHFYGTSDVASEKRINEE